LVARVMADEHLTSTRPMYVLTPLYCTTLYHLKHTVGPYLLNHGQISTEW